MRSNVIAPGPIDGTEGMDRLSANDKSIEQMEKSIPVQRMGSKEDVANSAVFLFSDAASFITGTVLVVDGGSEHVRTSPLPYPQSVLDPHSVSSLFRSKL